MSEFLSFDGEWFRSFIKEKGEAKISKSVIRRFRTKEKRRSLRGGLIYTEIDALSHGLTRSNGKDVSNITVRSAIGKLYPFAANLIRGTFDLLAIVLFADTVDYFCSAPRPFVQVYGATKMHEKSCNNKFHPNPITSKSASARKFRIKTFREIYYTYNFNIKKLTSRAITSALPAFDRAIRHQRLRCNLFPRNWISSTALAAIVPCRAAYTL